MASMNPGSEMTSIDDRATAIRILHVDDDPDFGELAATFLEREGDGITVTTATSVTVALERLREETFDCIISDYDMPRADGLTFLQMVRADNPDLPFILFTGKGSEEIASDAISAGVTDYLQKGTGTDQYAVLANRIGNTVVQHTAKHAIRETRERFKRLIEYSADVVSIVDANGMYQYLTPSSKRVLGYSPEELIGENGFEYVHPEDRSVAMEAFAHTVEDAEVTPKIEFRFDHKEDGWIWLENHARNLVDDALIGGFVVNSRNVTQRKRREQELTRQNERLESVVDAVSHDLRNPLNVAEGHLDLARRIDDPEHFDRVERAHDRVKQIIDDLVTLARKGETVEESDPVDLRAVVEGAWRNTATYDATLRGDATGTLRADRSRLQRLLENLFHNAVEHGSTGDRNARSGDAVEHGEDGVRVEVGRLESGFYVEDDGPGIPPEDRRRVFRSGYTTGVDRTGFGLAIVNEIVEAHGWEITVTDGREGGARFTITGIDFV